MKPREIKADLIRKGVTLKDIADEAGCSLSQVSMCISGNGLYLNVRELIAKALNKKVHEIFNKDHPQPKRKHVAMV